MIASGVIILTVSALVVLDLLNRCTEKNTRRNKKRQSYQDGKQQHSHEVPRQVGIEDNESDVDSPSNSRAESWTGKLQLPALDDDDDNHEDFMRLHQVVVHVVGDRSSSTSSSSSSESSERVSDDFDDDFDDEGSLYSTSTRAGNRGIFDFNIDALFAHKNNDNNDDDEYCFTPPSVIVVSNHSSSRGSSSAEMDSPRLFSCMND